MSLPKPVKTAVIAEHATEGCCFSMDSMGRWKENSLDFLGLGLPNKSNFNILHILKDFYFYEDVLLGRPLKVTNIQ